MKTSTFGKAVLLAFLLVASLVNAAAATPYRVGEVIEDFTLVRRDTRESLRLVDLEGRIVFLDWFAWWCPFCQAAAPQLLEGVDHWYESRGGNPDGIEVVHVGVNLQRGQEPQTQNFVERAGLQLVLEDFNRQVANQFFQGGGQPLFVIINGVAGSPSHAQWELVYSRSGYGERNSPVAEFRAAIDSIKKPVAPPAPPIFGRVSAHPEGGWLLEIRTEAGRSYEIQSSTDLATWSVQTTVSAASAQETVRIESSVTEPARFFRAVTR